VYSTELSPLLYNRGPTGLWALHDRLGEVATTAFLQTVRARRVDALAGFLRMLAEREGHEVARWFATQL
jgi:hypothetical protein